MVIVSTVIVSTIGQQTKLFTMVLYNINGWPIMTGTKSWYETALNGIDILSMFSFFHGCCFRAFAEYTNGNGGLLTVNERNVYLHFDTGGLNAWWLIPLSKWVITPIRSGLTLLIPFIIGVITHLRAVGWATKCCSSVSFFRSPFPTGNSSGSPRRDFKAMGCHV